ncbi:glycoside hydrolase [Mycena crocata]|nr:glycoside hydrolase [Mycena crocata]
MRLISVLGVALAALSSVPIVASREVFAHYMVGSVRKEHAEQDIDDAKAAGITGFSLNIGTPSKDFVVPTLNFLFDHAASVGGFHLHISMDIWASGDAAGGHPELYNDIVRGYVGKPAYFKVNGKPYITTFSDGGLTNDEWKAWKLNTLQNNLYFCPDFDGTDGYTSGADGWWFYWGDNVDCVFSWDAAWQTRGGIDPITGKPYAGSVSAGSIEIDQAVINSAKSRNKGYNMGFSALQYKNAYSTNVYRNGGMMARMANMLNMSPRPDFATALTWNDGPESHYIGSIWSEQNTDADPARYVTADPLWSHAAWRPIIASFADAFISGGGVSSMTPHGSSGNVIGALWYKTVLQGSTCPSGDHPGGWEKGSDDLNWGLVLKAGKDTSNYRLYLISGSTTVLHTGFKDGLNYGTVPLSRGIQRLELYDAARLIYEAKGAREVHTDCPDTIFNMNDVTASVLPPKLTGTTGLCTFHFTQYQKPNPASDPYTFSLTVC